MKVCIINGPNLNLLGSREKEIYGDLSFESYLGQLKSKYSAIEITYFQSNIEGEIINKLHECVSVNGIVLNAGAYTHTSLAIADAVASIKTPVVEVHISNIFSRENARHVSFVGAKCKGSISGFGLQSYDLALAYFLKFNRKIYRSLNNSTNLQIDMSPHVVKGFKPPSTAKVQVPPALP